VKDDAQKILISTDEKIDELVRKFEDEMSDIICENDRMVDLLEYRGCDPRTCESSEA